MEAEFAELRQKVIDATVVIETKPGVTELVVDVGNNQRVQQEVAGWRFRAVRLAVDDSNMWLVEARALPNGREASDSDWVFLAHAILALGGPPGPRQLETGPDQEYCWTWNEPEE